MNLEMHTEDKTRSYKRKRVSGGKRRKSRLSLWLGMLAAGMLCSLLLFIWILRGTQPAGIHFSKQFTKIYSANGGAPGVEAYASDIAVVEADLISTEQYGAEAGLVLGAQGKEIIFAKNVYQRMNPASTTKLMTLLLALKYGDLDDEVTLTQAVVVTEAGASLAHIQPGDTLTLRQLLYGLMLPSGNDAANAIAVHLSGSTEAFAEKMNEEAAYIYASGTQFRNAHGLTQEGHYSTAYDLYLIMREVMRYDLFREIALTPAYEPTYTLANGETFINHWDNSNKYVLGEVQIPAGLQLIGGKTGTTQAAGSCLVLAQKKEGDGKNYVSVVLKAANRTELYENMNEILQVLSEQS